MPKGVYPRQKRTGNEILFSMGKRLMDLSIPEPNSGCWLFLGTLDNGGYGRMAETKYKRTMAHRASYRAFVGAVPDGIDVLHSCDMPSCVNPQHLFVGTHADNMADMVRKKRSNAGGWRNPKDGICVTCGSPFKGRGTQITCSEICYNDRRNARRRSS